MTKFSEYLKDVFAIHKVKGHTDAVKLLKWRQVEILEGAKQLESDLKDANEALKHMGLTGKECCFCSNYTDTVFNIDMNARPVCENCARSIFIQQANWYTGSDWRRKSILPD